MRGICMYVYMCVRHPDCHHRRKTWNGRDEGGWGVHGCVRHPDCTTLAQKKKASRPPLLSSTRVHVHIHIQYRLASSTPVLRGASLVVYHIVYVVYACMWRMCGAGGPKGRGHVHTGVCVRVWVCGVVWCVWGGGRRFDVPTGKGRRHEKPDKSRNKRLNLSRS